MIIGCFGYQRSGKTALALMVARHFQHTKGFDIYSNVEADNVNLISKISDIPIDYKSKVVIFDEAYFFLDSRSFKDNKEFTLFLSTLGKQKVLLFVTSPTPDMIDIRIRKQLNYLILAKGDNDNIYYQIIDVVRSKKSGLFSIKKSPDLFKELAYNSNMVIPNYIECDVKNYVGSVTNIPERFNKKISL